MTSQPLLLHDLLAQHAANDKVAVMDRDDTIAYTAMWDLAQRYANALVEAGLKRGDRVAIFLPRGIEESVAIFAVSLASGVFVPVNMLLRGQQIAHIITDCDARIIITDHKHLSIVTDCVAGQADVTILVVEDMSATEAQSVRPQNIGEDLAGILYTSGSTGRPKGVMLSHRNLLAGTRIVRTYLGISSRDRILSILPFSFDYGLNQLLTSVEQGATISILSFRFGDEIVQALRDQEITALAGVPTVWAILTRAAPLLPKTKLPHLRYITNSGGAVPSQTVADLRRLLPSTDIYLMYGLTEAFRSTYLPPDELDRRPTSMGKAIPESEIFVITADGRRAAPGEPGILVHRGPTVSLGYWNRPDDTAKVLKPHPFRRPEQGGDVVCYSGDLVVEDEEGFFSFIGRTDAMIKSSGYRISPSEVEEALMATGNFRQVAVIGIPDAVAGQRVHAVAVPMDKPLDVNAVLRTISMELASYMVPKAIELVNSLPVTPNGKVDYRQLLSQRVSI